MRASVPSCGEAARGISADDGSPPPLAGAEPDTVWMPSLVAEPVDDVERGEPPITNSLSLEDVERGATVGATGCAGLSLIANRSEDDIGVVVRSETGADDDHALVPLAPLTVGEDELPALTVGEEETLLGALGRGPLEPRAGVPDAAGALLEVSQPLETGRLPVAVEPAAEVACGVVLQPVGGRVEPSPAALLGQTRDWLFHCCCWLLVPVAVPAPAPETGAVPCVLICGESFSVPTPCAPVC
jgi:hypothetical protein